MTVKMIASIIVLVFVFVKETEQSDANCRFKHPGQPGFNGEFDMCLQGSDDEAIVECLGGLKNAKNADGTFNVASSSNILDNFSYPNAADDTRSKLEAALTECVTVNTDFQPAASCFLSKARSICNM